LNCLGFAQNQAAVHAEFLIFLAGFVRSKLVFVLTLFGSLPEKAASPLRSSAPAFLKRAPLPNLAFNSDPTGTGIFNVSCS